MHSYSVLAYVRGSRLILVKIIWRVLAFCCLMKIRALLWSEISILTGIMRNLGLLLKDRTLDPFTFRKLYLLKTWEISYLKKKKKGSVCGLNFAMDFLKTQQCKSTSNSCETIILLGSIKECLACIFMIM